MPQHIETLYAISRFLHTVLPCLALIVAWVLGLLYLFSSAQDLVYNIGGYSLRLFRRIYYRSRERLTLSRLRDSEQQRIAVMIPAWQEATVIASMVANIIERVEYRNYVIFVGTYTNDPETECVVSELSRRYGNIVKIPNPLEGGTTKAQNLNSIYEGIKRYEQSEKINFDILVIHDAEDLVHPHSFLLHNYLIPRVDAIQLPILPLPTQPWQFIHWTYADEFALSQMRDVPVREKISGFVPFCGTGTSFSRRAFVTIELQSGSVFDDDALTEDYALGKKMREAGLNIIFCNLVLEGGKHPFWVPLCRRPEFIANWSYFPKTWRRCIRQRSRWIFGISLQEWIKSGWSSSGRRQDPRMLENLIKDRKVLLIPTAGKFGSFLAAYGIAYSILLWLAHQHPGIQLLDPIVIQGSVLHRLTLVLQAFFILYFIQKFIFVSMVYGVTAGAISIPRTGLGSLITAKSASEALKMYRRFRKGKDSLRWVKTDHLDGVGRLPSYVHLEVDESRVYEDLPSLEIVALLRSPQPPSILRGLNSVRRDWDVTHREQVLADMFKLVSHSDTSIRAALARVFGYLTWPETTLALLELIHDRTWVVRSNSARAILKFPNFEAMIESALMQQDLLVRETLVRTIEQDLIRQQILLPKLSDPNLLGTRTALLNESPTIRAIYLRQVGLSWDEFLQAELAGV